jgi:serine/threonine-protein kinase
VIEAHVARARGGALRDGLPVIEIAPRLSVGSPTPSDQRPAARPSSDPDLATSLDSPSARSLDASAAASDPRRHGRVRHLKPVLIAGAAGVAIAIAVIVFIARATSDSGAITSHAEPMPRVPAPQLPVQPAPQPPPQPAPPPVAKSAEPPPTPRPNLIDVEVRVSPGTATISIDGHDVEGNPFSSQFPGDEVMHRVRAVAPGYVTKSSSVAFNANVTLDFSLERVTPPPAPPPQRATPVRPPPRVVQQGGRTAPQRTSEPPRSAEPSRVETAVPRSTPAESPTPPPMPAGMVDPGGGKAPTRTIERKDPYNPGGGQQ